MLEAELFAAPATAGIAVLPPRAIVSLIAFKGQAGALAAALGVPLPLTPSSVVHGPIRYLWAGPAAWLALSDDPALPARLAPHEALAAITDQSDAHIILAVTGPAARTILAKLIPIDLHESAFPAHAVALTLAGHIAIKLWREDDAFILACPRSFAAALHHALVEAEQAVLF